MSLTLDEITEHEKRARREIAERECLLAALKVLRGYTAQDGTTTPTEVPFLLSGLMPFTSEAGWKELRASSPADPALAPAEAPPPPAQLPPPPCYVHPELAAIGHGHASIVKAVEWAIARMTDDYTARDIDGLLGREGHRRGTAEVSLVLTRLRERGEIVQLRPSCGPSPGVYQKPANPELPADEPEAALSSTNE